MSVTIKDVAKFANVAPSTVSRVIANNPRISDKTKEKVRAAMKELGYHPNFIARSLANQSTQVLGLVTPGSSDVFFQNPFFPTVLRGLSVGAHEKQYALQMVTGQNDEDIYNGVIQMVQGGRVDGVVLLYSKVEDRILTYLRERNFPFVMIGKPYSFVNEITHVDNNNFQASKDAANFLLSLGHTRLAFIGGDVDLVVTVERLKGYKKALEEADIPIRQNYILHQSFLLEGGRTAVCELMELPLHERPTALLVADDLMALGVLNTLNSLGISVPEDLSVLSFNNVLFSEMARPPLSSVDINIYELGYHASKHLIKRIENHDEPFKRVIIEHKIVTRQSTGQA
ncbi:LacI family DNA-binding transcriptional regulator [Jeotgalibacillus proteolyticus]|uniref:LacI family transcriptional regulator n=1 Tax=Jeotgalibacillus proteolyticus TaxID=2082395 RepID=A0A2S5GHF6_9BACL|nr:LacI family DNA-binding transcriptional regulator [Jeotgalibacillus proteolyticus]PPA72354.1 LacI family transcriptional regulator [Jeotgalibacillus proteolyticus]